MSISLIQKFLELSKGMCIWINNGPQISIFDENYMPTVARYSMNLKNKKNKEKLYHTENSWLGENLESSQRKDTCYRGTIRTTADFLLDSVQVKRQWDNIFQEVK